MTTLQSFDVELETPSRAVSGADLAQSSPAPVPSSVGPAGGRSDEAAESSSSLELSSMSISPSTSSVAPDHGSRRTATLRERCHDALGSTLTANMLVIPGLFIAIIGFAWMILTQRYTVRNDRLQDCLNYRQAGIITDVCEDTIAAGIPSFWRKRDAEAATKEYALLREILWLRRALALVFTVAVGISTIVWFRPKIALFPPVTSMVRSQPSTSQVVYHTFVSRECRRCGKFVSNRSSLAESRRGSIASTNNDLGSKSGSNPSILSFGGEDADLENAEVEGGEEENDRRRDVGRLSRAPKRFKQDDLPEIMAVVRTESPEIDAPLRRTSITPSALADRYHNSISSLHLPSLFVEEEDRKSEKETPNEEPVIEQEDICEASGSLTADMMKMENGISKNPAFRTSNDAVIAVHPLLLEYYYKLSNVEILRRGLFDFQAGYAQARTVRGMREEQGLSLMQSLGEFEEDWEHEIARVKQALVEAMAVADAAQNACLQAGLGRIGSEPYYGFPSHHTSGESACGEIGLKDEDDAHRCLGEEFLKTRSDALQQEIHQPSQDYAVSTMLESQGFIPPSLTIQEDGVYRCEGCRAILEEDKACEISGYRWHNDCFRCSTCETLLDPVANNLLLGDGSLVCNNCTYSCSACGIEIADRAILTADQTFCSSCFKCRSCKRNMETVRYFRTSKGNFCVECHGFLRANRERKSQKNRTSKARPSGISKAPKSEQSQPADVVSRGEIPVDSFEDFMNDSEAPKEPSLPLVAGMKPGLSSVVGSLQKQQDVDNTTERNFGSDVQINHQANDQHLAFKDVLEASKSSRAAIGRLGSFVPSVLSTTAELASIQAPPKTPFPPFLQTRRRTFDIRSWWSKRAET